MTGYLKQNGVSLTFMNLFFVGSRVWSWWCGNCRRADPVFIWNSRATLWNTGRKIQCPIQPNSLPPARIQSTASSISQMRKLRWPSTKSVTHLVTMATFLFSQTTFWTCFKSLSFTRSKLFISWVKLLWAFLEEHSTATLISWEVRQKA